MNKSRNNINCITGGFTLVELLIVIAVVLVLAAISIPLIGRARLQAQRSQCVSNLRQIGVGLFAYAADHKGQLPVQNWWNNGAAPSALSVGGSSTDPAIKSNGLGFLASMGYLGGPDGVGALTGAGKPQVLRCPGDDNQFFNKPGAGNWCSYVYQSPFPVSSGSTDSNRPNLANVLSVQMALVTEAAQVFSNNPPPHEVSQAPVLYGDGRVMLRPWRGGSNELSVDSQPRNFDLASGLRN